MFGKKHSERVPRNKFTENDWFANDFNKYVLGYRALERRTLGMMPSKNSLLETVSRKCLPEELADYASRKNVFMNNS